MSSKSFPQFNQKPHLIEPTSIFNFLKKFVKNFAKANLFSKESQGIIKK